MVWYGGGLGGEGAGVGETFGWGYEWEWESGWGWILGVRAGPEWGGDRVGWGGVGVKVKGGGKVGGWAGWGRGGGRDTGTRAHAGPGVGDLDLKREWRRGRTN